MRVVCVSRRSGDFRINKGDMGTYFGNKCEFEFYIVLKSYE